MRINLGMMKYLKKVCFIILLLMLTSCGVAEEDNFRVEEIDSKSESKVNEVSAIGYHTLHSYDVVGNPIDENLKITNVFKEMPTFVKPDRIPTEGTHFECVEYSLDHSPREEFYYVNIYIKGLDGEKLSHDGKVFSQRTYDFFDYITDKNEMIYCYYEVPDGVTQYVLEFVNEIECNSTKFFCAINWDL